MPTVLEVPVLPTSAKSMLRRFVNDIIGEYDDVDYGELIRRATVEFSRNPEFQLSAAHDIIPMLITHVLRDVVHHRKDAVVTSRGYLRNSRLEATTREKLERVLESTGNGYRRFLDLKKPDLLALNDRDNQQIRSMSKWVSFRSDLAGRMSVSQVVADLPSGTLDQVWRSHFDTEEATA